MLKTKSFYSLFFASACFFCLPAVTPAVAGEEVESIVKEGSFFGEARYRYEFVDQDGVANEGKASTVRTNLGFKTGVYKDFQALIEGQLVQNIGANSFNDTVNGKATYPVVADPDTAELNQLWLSWAGLAGVLVKAGRQGINLDNQRFVGTVGWRQNDQTFDSIVFNYNGIENVALQYGYVWNVNRIFGDDHPLGDLDSQSHFAKANYDFAEWLHAGAYGYWLNFDELPAGSSQTYGVRLTGKVPVDDAWALSYEAEVALQEDYGDNTSIYDEMYYHISPAVSGHGFTVQAGYEVLGGDGTNSFQTPLATLHKFNGWADKFLMTPANGLEDIYGKISYKVSDAHALVDGTVLTAVYHDFDGDERGDYGSEIDLSVGKTFQLPEGQPFKNLNVLVKYADYSAEDAPFTDTQKVWLQVGVKF